MPSLDIACSCEEPRWQAAGLEAATERALGAVAARLIADDLTLELAVLGTDDTRIAALNAQFRAKPAPTNVLSWPAEALTPPALPAPDFDGLTALGDLALAYETCAREAGAQGKPFADHVTHLVVHGILHLLGYDHETDAEAAVMEALEVEILGNLGIADPY